MIRDVVVHLHNEQPLMADLYALPTATDAGLVCTNLRTMTRTRPVFVDDVASVFFFPYNHIRFLEIHPDRAAEAGIGASGVSTPARPHGSGAEGTAVSSSPPLAADGADAPGSGVGEFNAGPEGALPALSAPSTPSAPPDADLELDEEFLRKIRDV